MYCLNIYTVINERRKITGKFAPIYGKDRPKGQICPLAKKEVFYYDKKP